MQQHTDNPVLFITLSNIGDAIMTTPVLQALHTMYPGKVIDIVADQRSSEIFFNCPFRGDIFIKNKKLFLRGVPELLKKLRRRNYDLVVDLRTDGLAYLLHARKKLSRWHRGKTGNHAVQQHMGVIASLYQDTRLPRCHVWIGKDDEQFAGQVLNGLDGKTLLALGPGANAQRKIWPGENYTALLNRLSGKTDAVILLGNRDDSNISKNITAPCGLPVLDLCGRTSILQAAAVLQHATAFVGNDSGLGHIAAALGVPTITIFGPGDPERYRPWSENSQCVTGDSQDIRNVSVDEVVKHFLSIKCGPAGA